VLDELVTTPLVLTELDSLVLLAGRLETTRVATFDQRHFRSVRPLAAGDTFALLPADA
jgi:uncharacterized protein